MAPAIYIIEDDPLMAECIAKACLVSAPPPVSAGQPQRHRPRPAIFADALAAVQALAAAPRPPALIFLDILLTGPDGFTLLNELASYPDTAQIPIVVVSSLDFSGQDLSPYGVVAALDKATMRPADIKQYVQRYCFGAADAH